MKKLLVIFAAAAMLFTAGCAKDNNGEIDNAENQQVEQKADLYAEKVNFTIEMENGGVMKGELYPLLAPVTVENFINLAKNGAYDGLIFHRVIPGFMIQGGGYNEDMKELEAEAIAGEFASNGFENELLHERGVISMARTNDPNSASSQFFIMHEASPHLDGEYAAFGKITEGLEVVDEIANTETTTYQGVLENFPVEAQVIKTITIEE